MIRALTHRATAYFQAALSIVFIIGYFLVLFLFLSGHVRVPGEFHDMIQTLIGVLTGALGVIIQFWFSRQRVSADPQPAP
jgi:uncharacterized membrane protein YczE